MPPLSRLRSLGASICLKEEIQLSRVVVIATNTPGQVRGPKASLLPFPERGTKVVSLLNAIRKEAGVKYAAATLAEFSNRSAEPISKRKAWRVERGPFNDIFGPQTIGNAIAARRGIDFAAHCTLSFKVPGRERGLHMPVRLLVTDDGAPFVLIAAHIPTRGDASLLVRRRICKAIVAYADKCAEAGLPVVIAGDFNRSHVFFPRRYKTAGTLDVQRVLVRGAKVIKSGQERTSHGKVTDHQGFPWAVLDIPVQSVQKRTLPRV